MRIVLLGAPGSGKGTQGARLASRFGVPHIASGALLRRVLDLEPDSELASAARPILKGRMVSDAVADALAQRELSRREAARGFVLDGYPRNATQASALDGFLDKRGERLDAAVELVVGVEELRRRLAGRRECAGCGASFPASTGRDVCPGCGGDLAERADDQPEAVPVRLALFEERIGPLREHYAERGVLRRVDATGEPESVFARVCAALTALV